MAAASSSAKALREALPNWTILVTAKTEPMYDDSVKAEPLQSDGVSKAFDNNSNQFDDKQNLNPNPGQPIKMSYKHN